MHAFTIVNRRDLSFALALGESYRRHHAESEFAVFVLDRVSLPPTPDGGVQLRAVADILGRDLGLLGAMHPPAVLPLVALGGVLETLLGESGSPVMYLHPTMLVQGPLEELERAMQEHEVVLVPNTFGPLPSDDLEPSQVEILERGAFSMGVLCLRSGDGSEALLRGWPRDLDYGRKDSPREAFQRWLDSVPATLPDVAILREPGYNAAYWNLAGRTISRVDDDGLQVDGSPLRLLNLTDFDPLRPDLLAPKQQRVLLSKEPALREICANYGQQLVALGWEAEPGYAVPYTTLPDESRLTDVMRALFRRGLRDGDLRDSPFEKTGLRELRDYLNAPATRGSAAGLTRLHETIWEWRDDLRTAYPHLDGPDGAGYAGWLWVYGEDQESVVHELRPPAPPHLESARPADAIAAEPPWGVNVAGFFTSELGLGEAARLLLSGLDARNIPALPIQGRLLPPCRQGAEFTYVAPTSAPYLINIICMNGDSIPQFAREAGAEFFKDRYSIALWWWEVGEFPEDWRDAFEYIDEVWVASEHIREAIAPESPVPVVKVPLPVSMPQVVPYGRGDLGLPEDGYLFLFIYDYHSTIARKNPLGLIEAFGRAFAPNSGAKLVLKCINAERLPDDHERVLVAAAEHPDITIIDRYVSANEKNAMIAACDCYVSLHRSEGFGLTPAEAMLLEKPVIVTNYGGTREFTSEDNSYLVDWLPAEVGEHAHPYPAKSLWADPDLDQAARLMRHVFEHQDEARERGRIAARDMHSNHSPVVAGAEMERRLLGVYEREREQQRETPPDSGLQALEVTPTAALIDSELPTPHGRLRALKRLARALASKIVSPWMFRQRRINRELLALLTRLDEHVNEVSAGLGDGRREQRANLAETLSAFRKVRAELADTGRGVVAAERYLGELDCRTEHHLAQHEALPYMAENTRFQLWNDPAMGIVAGFRTTGDDSGDGAVYRSFEDAFRGPEQRVREIQSSYLPLLTDAGPVMDIGCGRGEMLDLLREQGIEATGVDLDEGMVAHARAKGHDVAFADGNAELDRREDGSLGAIVAIEVIEHLPYDELLRFLRLARAKLRSGGKLIVETVNPHALHAMKAFWVDPTHQHPIFPEVALQLCRSAGFAQAYCFHPTGSGDVEADRYREPVFAVVAEAPRGVMANGRGAASDGAVERAQVNAERSH